MKALGPRWPVRLRSPASETGAWARWGRLRTALLAGAVVVVVAVVGLLQVRISTDVESFVPADTPSVLALADQARSFGGDPIVILLESDNPDVLFGQDQLPRLLSLEGRLAKLPDVGAVYGPGTALNQVATQAQDMLARISGRRDALRIIATQKAQSSGLSPDQIAAAAAQATAEFDQRYGSLLVLALPAGLPTLHNPSFVRTVLFDQQGQTRPMWEPVVPSHTAAAILIRPHAGIDQAATEQLVAGARAAVSESQLRTSSVTISGVPTITAALGTQVRQELPLLGAAALILVALCLLLARVPDPRRRLMPLLVAVSSTGLVMAAVGWAHLRMSLGVVAFLPVLFGIAAYYPLYLEGSARRRRVVVAALASAASFASLALSPLPFVRQLGLTLASGVLVAVGLSLAVLRVWPGLTVEARPSMVTSATGAGQLRRTPTGWRRVALLGVLLILSGLGWMSLPGVPVSADPQRLAGGLSAIQDARHVEHVLGSSGEVSVVLRGHDVLTPEALRWSRAAESAIILAHGDSLRPIVSVSDLFRFLGEDATQDEITAATELIPPYLSGTVVSDDHRRSLLSFGLRLQDLQAQRTLIEAVRTALPPTPPDFRADVVGLPVVAVDGFQLASSGRYAGNILGILVATVVLALGLRRRVDALRAALAAALASGWGLALIWATGQELSPITVALGSLTAAVGCEFTVLLAHAARDGQVALRRSVGLATLTSAVGFAVLTCSGLAVIRQFGLFLAGAVILSYLAGRLVNWLYPPSPSPAVSPTASVLPSLQIARACK